MDSNYLIKQFKNPDAEYEPVVMWFWGDTITEDGITFQMEQFRSQNIINFFVHPAGCNIEYLSDRYMELIQHVVKEAKRLGMYYWIYDEYDYPSGIAGGIFCDLYPELRQKELHMEEFTMWPHDKITFARPGKLVAAQYVTEKNGKNYVVDVTHKCKTTQHGNYTEISYWYDEANIKAKVMFFINEYNLSQLPSGMFRIGKEPVKGYVDMLSAEAVRKYIEITHERYKAYVGDEFGKTVRGVFTDEPTILRHFDGTHAGPWRDDYDEIFQKEHGYSIIPYLYLFWDVQAKSPEEIKAVHDHRATLRRLYHGSFMEQYSKWCKDNNLIFTGHFGGEENLFGHYDQADMLEELTMFDVPGMDSIISSQKIEDHNFNITPKLPSSAAKFIGSDRVFCETYTGSGWYMRMCDMKRIANRLMLLGINRIQYMGAFYSIGGSAKNYPYGYAPSHGYQNPYFPFYHKLGKHIASFSALSANTVPDSSVLMFIPLMQTIQERYTVTRNKMSEGEIFESLPNRAVTDSINALIAEGIGFDMFSENLVDNIKVFDGYIEAYGYRYDVVFFPRMRCVNKKTRELIARLKEHQVKTIFLYELPGVETDSGESFDPGYRMAICNSALQIQNDGNAYLITPNVFPMDMALHRSALQSIIGTRHLNFGADEGVFITKRSNDDAEVYFLCNDKETPANANFDALPGMRILDPNTREEAVYTVKDGRVFLTLEGNEMLAIVRDKACNVMPETTDPGYTVHDCVTLEGPYDFTAADGNYLPLDYEMYDPDTGLWDPCRFLYLSDQVHVGMDDVYHVRSKFYIDDMPSFMTINAEVEFVNRIVINGTDVPFCANIQRWSPADFTTDITSLLKLGENTIEVEAFPEPQPKMNRPPYIYLAGDFELDSRNHMITPRGKMAAGGWEKAGYPKFCGVGIYKTSFTAAEGYRKIELTLNTRDIAQVYINGQLAGTRLWLIDHMDITDFVRPGENELEVRITSPRANMFAAEWYPHAPHLSLAGTENGIMKPMEIHYMR